jgi:xanthine/uracil permease
LITILIGFLAGMGTDFIWAKYVDTIAQKRAFAAANWSIAIHVCSLVATVLLIDKAYLAIAAYLIGGYIGTFCAVTWGKKNVVSPENNSLPLQ